MALRRSCLLIVVVLGVSACGGGGTGVTMPTPTPTPPPGGFGTVNGATAVVASGAARAAAQPARPLRTSINRPTQVPDQLLVKFRPAARANAAAVHAQVGATVLRTIDRLDVQVVRLRPGASAQEAIAAYRTSGLVEYVEQDGYAYASRIPNDPSFAAQWHYPQINLPLAWDTTIGGPVIVAVLDTGYRTDHPDAGFTVTGFDMITRTDNGDGDGRDADPTDPGCPGIAPSELSHGTHVAGTVATHSNNAVGVAGVNWGGSSSTRLMILRVLGQLLPSSDPLDCGVGTFSDIADALMYAADHGAKVANMSLGCTGAPPACASSTLDAAIVYAAGRGVTMVAAAGNSGCPGAGIDYPARHAMVIPVGGTNINNARASYSSCGAELRDRGVVAPGGDGLGGVLSTTWSITGGHVYVAFQGTSMATPHVAGVIALMITRGNTSPSGIQSTLRSTATDLGAAGPDIEFGAGLVNAAAAIGGGSGPTRMCAFTGSQAGTVITRQSDMRPIQSNGTFSITNAQSGVTTVFVWQDIDGSMTVTPGDIYGETPGVPVFPGGTTSGIAVTVQTRATGSAVLTVGGGAAACP
ncbi:MAG TPA: S8 family serine peptidase [bacterium]|nr:S8 family serine peptidase [bacterium]